MKEIILYTTNGLKVTAMLLNPFMKIAYCQDRLVRVSELQPNTYIELKSLDIIPILEKEGMWHIVDEIIKPTE